MLSEVSTTLEATDNAGFTAGRFTYMALDPGTTTSENKAYNSMLSLAMMGYASGKKVYANVTSRLARVNWLSISDQENNN